MKYTTRVLSTLSSQNFLKMCTMSYILKKNDSAYGREIILDIQNRNSLWQPSHGTLYPILNEMVEEGLLYIDEEEGKRKYYKVTRKGKNYYKKVSKEFVDVLNRTSEFYRSIASDMVLFDDIKEEKKIPNSYIIDFDSEPLQEKED